MHGFKDNSISILEYDHMLNAKLQTVTS